MDLFLSSPFRLVVTLVVTLATWESDRTVQRLGADSVRGAALGRIRSPPRLDRATGNVNVLGRVTMAGAGQLHQRNRALKEKNRRLPGITRRAA
jgi:hypothetical protein